MAEEKNNSQNWSSPFEAKHFRWIVFSSFFLVLGILIYLIYNPTILDYNVIKSIVLILISLYLTLMFFILWPHNATLDKVPYLNSKLKIAGPIVLWIVIFIVTNNIIPESNSQEKTFIIYKTNPNFRVPYHDTKLISEEISENYLMIEDPDFNSHLKAIYVKFPPGKNIINAFLHFDRYKPYPIKLDRQANIIKIENLQKNE